MEDVHTIMTLLQPNEAKHTHLGVNSEQPEFEGTSGADGTNVGGTDGNVTVEQLEKTFRRLRRAAKSEIYCVRGRESAKRLARLLEMGGMDPRTWLSDIERSGEGSHARGTGSPTKHSSEWLGLGFRVRVTQVGLPR